MWARDPVSLWHWSHSLGGGEAASFDTFAIGPPPPPPPPVDWEDAPAETVSAVAQQAAQAAVEKVGVLWRCRRATSRME